MSGQGYRDLIAWQKAMDMCQAVYRISADLPDEEKFGLRSQLQRASVSIPSNIAEGHARGSKKDYARHLGYALGSLAEVETQLEIAVRVGALERDLVRDAWALCQETGKLVTRLRQSLTRDSSS
ncbi:MAG: four helix bundle protein [Planctomycetota bacterium]